MTNPCGMDVGCDESGVCYAAAMGQPWRCPHHEPELSKLRQAIIDNTKGDLFWIGEILLSELEKETGFRGDARQHS